MTVQEAEYMHIDRKKYVLIDIERRKQIIDCAVFVMPEPPEGYSNEMLSTSCKRGYTADYFVENDILYGVKKEEIYFIDDTNYQMENKENKSPKTMIPFTGSCIIAYGGGWNSDFLEAYLHYDEALELYFEQGLLKEKHSLNSAIEKARAFRESDEYRKMTENFRTGDRSVALKIKESTIERFTREPLKYEYGERTYKWRYGDIDEDWGE